MAENIENLPAGILLCNARGEEQKIKAYVEGVILVTW